MAAQVERSHVHEHYLLLTPLLTLLVVALVGFVGCDIIFGLDHVDYAPPRNLTFERSSNRIDLSWEPPTEGPAPTHYDVSRGGISGDYDITFTVTGSTSYSDQTAINGVTYFYKVFNGQAGSNQVEVPPAFTGVTSLITSSNPSAPRNNFGGFVGMGIRIGAVPMVVKTLGRMAVADGGASHLMKIVDGATKADVPGGSATVLPASGTAMTFVYAPLPAAVTLNPGQDYYILSREQDMGDQFFDSSTTVTTTPGAVTMVYAVNGDNGMYTVSPIQGMIYGPVDVQYQE
jgi:hypothetical protein